MEDKESLIKLLERDGYEYEFGENERLKTSKRGEAVHYYEGELYFIHPLLSEHASHFQFIPSLKGFSVEERPFSTSWGNGEELSEE